MSPKKTIALWVLISLGAWSCARSDDRPVTPSRSTPDHASDHAEVATVGEASEDRSGSYSGGFVVLRSDEVFQIVKQPTPKSLLIRTVDLTVDPFTQTEVTYSASFDVTSIAARGQNDLYVAGTARNGDLVIEHWLIEPRPGAIVTGWQSLGAGVMGQPSPGPVPTTTIFGGGPYVPVAQRAGHGSIQRSEILRTNQYTIHNNAFGVDPEGRFLLFVTNDGELYQLDLSVLPSPPVLLHDATTLWTLPHVEAMTRMQITGVGRIWALHPPELLPNPDAGGALQVVITYLYDSDNDGFFEQGVVHQYKTLATSGLWDLIETDFAFVYP